MATKTPRTTRTSKTKAEVKEDFEEIASKVRGAEALPVKEAELKAARDANIRKSVEDISPEAITQKVTAAQFAINRTLASVQEQLVQQTQELEAIKQAKELVQTDLANLHGADKVLTALDVLVQEYDEKAHDLDVVHTNRVQQLSDEIAKMRQAWSEEQALHNKAVTERNAEAQKTRQREQADFDYNVANARKIDQDKWNEQLRLLGAQERDRRDSLEKTWNEREVVLAQKETEFAQLKAQVEAFPAKLDAETKKAEAIVGNTVKREYEHRIQLIQKDAESQQRVLEMQITSLQDAVQKQQITIAELQLRLKDSESNVKSIAEKALDSAGSTRTLSEMRIMQDREQANGGGRSKS